MSRDNNAPDFSGVAIDDPPAKPYAVDHADKRQRGQASVIARQEDGQAALLAASASGWTTLATIADARGSLIDAHSAQVQGIGTDSYVATLDPGEDIDGGTKILRVWANPAVLRVGPATKRARFSGH